MELLFVVPAAIIVGVIALGSVTDARTRRANLENSAPYRRLRFKSPFGTRLRALPPGERPRRRGACATPHHARRWDCFGGCSTYACRENP